jgi:hypothetical protein
MKDRFPDEFYTAFGVALPSVLADRLNKTIEHLKDVIDRWIEIKEEINNAT